MTQSGKKHRKIASVIPAGTVLSAKDALRKIKALAYAKFDESVDVDVMLGIDTSKGDQVIRSAVQLPHGNGKKNRVLVFAKGDYADAAKAAGADYVGTQDLIEKIQSGWLDFEIAIATPDLMGTVGQLAKFLGPRGLLPNKKDDTVTFDVAQAVKNFKSGRVRFKNDKQGIVHFSIGKVSFDEHKLYDNLTMFIKSLIQAKPSTAKGKFIKKLSITSTMGIGIVVNFEELGVA
ncbi:MAG TPA: 50S ribosomal protein L1 [Patescibacteria group bacterium]|jgi:large subunit ribosomal protein L1|nr:50S ribosomal protein L1 [Patescibacteria group bacterium]